MQKKNALTAAAFLSALLIVLFVLWAGGAGPVGRPHFKVSNLTVVRSDGVAFPFSVEVASTPDEQSYGLMFVHKLGNKSGMIFPYAPARPVAFWMKNTLIPLDMLFVRPDGTIGRIVINARPEDVTPIPSDELVSGVIELAGGVAKTDGLTVGDKIVSPVLPASLQ